MAGVVVVIDARLKEVEESDRGRGSHDVGPRAREDSGEIAAACGYGGGSDDMDSSDTREERPSSLSPRFQCAHWKL